MVAASVDLFKSSCIEQHSLARDSARIFSRLSSAFAAVLQV